MNNVLQWKIAAKQADYNALVAKDSDTLYFVQDTGEIYKGEQTFTQAVILYGADQTIQSRPAAGAWRFPAAGLPAAPPPHRSTSPQIAAARPRWCPAPGPAGRAG